MNVASETGIVLYKPSRELTKIILCTNALKSDIPQLVQHSSMFVIRETQSYANEMMTGAVHFEDSCYVGLHMRLKEFSGFYYATFASFLTNLVQNFVEAAELLINFNAICQVGGGKH